MAALPLPAFQPNRSESINIAVQGLLGPTCQTCLLYPDCFTLQTDAASL